VAALAGVSVEHVTRLEQGRDRRPSPQVLAAIADALQLAPRERAHLFRLTKASNPTFNCRGEVAPARGVRPTVRALLDRLEPTPAMVVNQLGDLAGYTAGFQRLVDPIGLLDAAQPNLARYVFADSRSRKAFPDGDRVADEEVAALKHGPFRADPHVAALSDELAAAAGDAFTTRVTRVPGLPRPNGVLRLTHPDLGMLRLAYETLELPADDAQRLVVYLPADSATAAALDRLSHSPVLRLVSG